MNVENDIEYLKDELRKKEELINKLLLEVENLKSNNIDIEINLNQDNLQEVSDDSILTSHLILNKYDENYKSIIQTLQEGIIIQDKNGNFIDANDHASLILGLSIEQLFGLTTFDPMWSTIKEDGTTFPPEEHPINISLYEGIILNNIIMGVRKPNNELTWISVNSSPIFDNTNNDIIGSVASFKDITLQKINNDDLKRNFKLLEASQLIGKLGGWELDLTTGNLFWTAETYRIHETSPEEFNPTVDAGVSYFLPESKETIIKALETAMTIGTGYDLYLETYTTKGNLIDVRTTCEVTMLDGKPIKLTGIFQDITEQKRIERELKKVSERLSLAVNAGEVGIWDWDIINNHMVWDEQMYKLYGIQENDYLSAYDAWTNSLFIEDRRNAELDLEMSLKGEKDFSPIFRIKWKDDSVHYIKAIAEIIRDEDGNPTRMIGTNWDITEIINAQNKIIETESKFKTIVENLQEGIAIHDENLYITDCNSSAENILGLTLDQMQGRTSIDENWKTIHEDGSDYNGSTRPILKTLETGETLTNQIMGVYKPNGELTWISINTVPLYNKGSKKPNGVLASFQDITSKKTSEILLNERKRSLEDIFNFSPVPFVITKISNGEIIMINNSLSNLLEEDASEIIGKFSYEYYSNKIDRNKILESIEQHGELNNLNFILKTTTGKEIECLTSSKKIKLNNEFVNLISFLDIRKIKETETALIKAKNYAEEMSKLKSSFLANMSHELRTPMNGILGFSQFMNSLDDIEEAKEISELIFESAKRLMETLNLILDISTIESGVNEIEFENFDIIKIINDNITLFSKLAISKSLSLTLNTKFEKLIVNSNSKILHSIMSNLINNAIKFTNKGGIRIDLNIIPNKKHSTHKKWLKIKVIDTGIGIAKKHRKIIFDEFRQVSEGINRNFEGSGLGLTLTKKYVNLLGGEISVKSEVDKGSTFTFKIPI